LRLPTNRRTANQLSPIWEEVGRESAQVDGAHAGKPDSVEKPYLKSRHRASGSYY
jgi:hypothetical protein